MASIGGLSSGLSSTSSIRGYGGLASGLDRDTLIEQLTYGTRKKIEAQKQKQDKIKWEQSALRSIIDKGYDFTNKYLSYASSSNLLGDNLFSRNDITAVGANSKYVSVTGSASAADMFSILGIKQMAEDAKMIGGVASDGALHTGAISSDFNSEFEYSQIQGEFITFKIGSQSYSVTMGTGNEYDYKNDLAGAINKSMEKVEIFGGKKLSDVVEASVADGKVSFKSKDTAGNSIEITGGSGDVLQHLGFLKEGESIADLGKDALVMSNGQTITAGNVNQAMKSEKISDFLAGKSLSFSYNGVNKTIEIGSGLNSKADLVNDLQSKLDDAFGKGRIRVDTTDVGDQFKLNFKTVTPKGEEDKSSSLILTGGDENLMGKNFGLLKVDENVSNRVNLSASLKDSGLAGAEKLDLTNSKILIINGVSVEITKDMTVEDIMKKFNEDKNADFVISYQKDSDRFMVTSKEKGASGTIEIGGDKEVAEMFFGTGALDKVAKGQDAVLQVKYAGDDMPTEIVRNSNSFTMDGLTVSLKGTFGYDEKGNLDPTAEAITFDANVDTETASKTVKEMVTAFNEILELINKEAKTKPNRDYQPLTAEQKKDMSESEIKEYEAKAKEGLLFGDTDVRGFADALRFVIPTGDRAALEEIGITTSTNYADNGKLVFDEAKFKSALEKDPEKVKELFTRKSSVNEDGTIVSGGFMSNIETAMKQYVGTIGATKGILVERAGSSHAPTTVLKNTLQKEIEEIDKRIEKLLDRLEMEEDRYISQFTTLETLISQMNSQSSYLSQLSGGY